MIPKRFEPVLFSFVLSGIMSAALAVLSTLAAHGAAAGFVWLWSKAWVTGWMVAFPLVVVAAPVTRRVVGQLVRQ